MNYNPHMPFSGQDYHLVKTSVKKDNNQKEVLRYLTNVLPNPTDIVTLDNAQNTVKSVKAQLANKNLIPYPYFDSSKSSVGATITVNDDRSISFSGTPTQYIGFTLYKSNALVKSGTFTISVGNLTNISTTLFIYDGSGATLKTYSFTKSLTVNADDYPTAATWNITMARAASNVEISGTSYPQLELGTTATAYAPYVSDFSTVKVTGCGKNLLDVSKFPLTPALQSDGSYILSSGGIKVDDTKVELNLPAGVYFISIDIKTPIGKNYRPIIVYVDGSTQDSDTLSTGEYTHIGFATNGKAVKEIFLMYSSGTLVVQFKNFQLELGETETEYEPYQGQTYTPTADGEVIGIEVLTPTTNIINDKGLLFTKVIGDDFNYIS